MSSMIKWHLSISKMGRNSFLVKIGHLKWIFWLIFDFFQAKVRHKWPGDPTWWYGTKKKISKIFAQNSRFWDFSLFGHIWSFEQISKIVRFWRNLAQMSTWPRRGDNWQNGGFPGHVEALRAKNGPEKGQKWCFDPFIIFKGAAYPARCLSREILITFLFFTFKIWPP